MEDDWLFDSLDRYERLHMFELNHATRCLEWTQNGTAICLAGFSEDKPNEILQLALPEKLLPQEQQMLCAKRDFTIISGAFSKFPVTLIKYIANNNLIATGCQSCVHLWTESKVHQDVLTQTGEISLKVSTEAHHSGVKMDWTASYPTALLAGHSLNTVQLVDIQNKKILYEISTSTTDSSLHEVCFAGRETSLFATCSGSNGELDIWDPRTGNNQQPVMSSRDGDQAVPQSKSLSIEKPPHDIKSHEATSLTSESTTTPESISPDYTLAFSHDIYPSARCAALSSDGALGLFDARNFHRPLASCSRLQQTQGVVKSRFTSTQPNIMCIQFSPSSTHQISLSGLAKGVSVYDTAAWTAEMKVPPTPLFTHVGHEQESPSAHVLCHTWHPSLPLLLSTDSEGSLHAWQSRIT